MMVSYANMKLKVDNSTTDLVINENTTIKVFNYLPIAQKYDLIMISLQQSEENGFYNPIKLDMYFHLNMIYMYTDINFTDKQREDEEKIYDNLKSNGILDKFLEIIPDNEYNDLYEWLITTQEALEQHNKSFVGFLQKFIGDMPKNAEAMKDIVNNFDKDKFQEVVDFARAANGGRDIE